MHELILKAAALVVLHGVGIYQLNNSVSPSGLFPPALSKPVTITDDVGTTNYFLGSGQVVTLADVWENTVTLHGGDRDVIVIYDGFGH